MLTVQPKIVQIATSAAVTQPTAISASRDWTMVRFVGIVFLISRLVYGAAVVVAAHIPIALPLVRPVPQPFWLILRQWDAGYYQGIAQQGYPLAHRGDLPAFFPGYPILIKLVAPLTGGDLQLAALLVTNVAWFFALCLIYTLARRDFNERVARGAVLGMALFPTAFFAFVPYPTGLYLALAIGSFSQMRSGHWRTAALLGMGAALTRQSGALLLLPFCWEYARQHGWDVRRLLRNGQRNWRAAVGHVRRDVLWAAAIPGGTALYMLWLWIAIGDPLAFLHVEAHWARTTMWPWQTIWLGMQGIFHQNTMFLTLREGEEIAVVLVTALLIGLSVRVLPASYNILAITLLVLFLSHPTSGWIMDSQARYMLEIFPIFLMFGLIYARWRWAVLPVIVVCVPLQVVLLAIFARHGWVI